jgi:hypothetical protein
MPTRFMQGTAVLQRNPRYFDVSSVAPGRILVRSGARGFTGVDVVVGFDGEPGGAGVPVSGARLVAARSAPGDPAVLVVRNGRPGSDANLRQALRALVPVPAMRQAADGAVAPEAGLTPPAWPGAVEVPLPGGRPEVAAAAAALVPQESRRLALAYLRGSVTMQQRAGALAAAAEPLGLTLVPTPLGRSDLDRALATGGFDAALVNLAPSVAHASELTRTYALTRGFGGGWPAAPAARAFPAQLIRPGSPELAVAATDRFEATLRRDATVIPLAIDPRRVLTGPDVLAGVVPGVDGSLALETIAVRAR